MSKKLFLFVLLVAMLLSLAACAPAATPEPAVEAEEPAEADLPTFAMVCSGSLGDSGIFDSGNEGLQKAAEDYGVTVKVLEGKDDPSLYYDLLKTAASEYDVVFVNPGYQFANELGELAPEYPDTKFVFADGVSDVEGANILSVQYKENEGSYTAGVMAAMMTSRTDIEGINEDKVLGLVGALDIPVINNFVAGFKQGVASVDPEVEVKVLYVGDFNDPAKGKELALSLYEQGADIVYAVAANSGSGVYDAACENGMYAIGVDTNKDGVCPGHIMGSMLKRVDNSFYDIVDRAVAGNLEGGVAYRYGVAENGVGMTYSDLMLQIVPEDIVAAMREADQKISNGEITVDEVK